MTWLLDILTSGLKEQLSPEDRVRVMFLNSILLFGGLLLVVFAVLDYLAGLWTLGHVVSGVALLVFSVFAYTRWRRDFSFGTYFIPLMMLAFYGFVTATGGAENSGILWALTYPAFAIFLLGPRWGLGLSLVFIGSQLLLVLVPGWSPIVVTTSFLIRLCGAYILILVFSTAIESIRRRTQRDVESARKALAEQADALLNAKAQTDGILAHVQEGIFLLNDQLQIGDQHSRELGPLLGTEHPAGRTLPELLGPYLPSKEKEGLADYLSMYFAPKPNYPLLAEINPLESLTLLPPGQAEQAQERHLEFRFGLVRLAQGERRILGTVRDLSAQVRLNRQLQEEERRSDRQMKTLFQILHVRPELMTQFLEDANLEIEQINSHLKSEDSEPGLLLPRVFHSLHAIKGNAALLGLSSLMEQAHALESQVRSLQKHYRWEGLLDLTFGLSGLRQELEEIQGLLGRLSSFQAQSPGGGEDPLSQAARQSAQAAAKARGLELRVESELGDLTGFQSEDRRLAKDLLVQFCRNAAVHGFETLRERQALGKPAEGLISWSLNREDREWVLRFADDGRGLDAARLRAKAASLPAFQGQDLKTWPEAKIFSLIFQEGFSTAAETDAQAGRGVGLGLVRRRLEERQGRLRLRNRPGQGLALEARWPLQAATRSP